MASTKYLDKTGLTYFWSKIKTYITNLLSSKANDSDVVHKTGTETIAGVKTFTDHIIMSNSKVITLDMSASIPEVSTVRDFPFRFKTQSTAGDYVFDKYPFFEIPSTTTSNYGIGVGFGASGLVIVGAGESSRNIVAAEELTGTQEKLVLTSDTGIELYVDANTIANRRKLGINTAGTTFLYSLCSTYADRTRGDTITSWNHKTLYFGDKYSHDNYELLDSHTYAWVRSTVSSDTSTLALKAFRNTVSDNSFGITITAPTDTNSPCYAALTASPVISDNSTKIPTTEWVRSATGNFACNAATATKLGTVTIGGESSPIYLSSGSPVEAGMSLYPYKLDGIYSDNAGGCRWSYQNLGDDSTSGFNGIKHAGRYHVRYGHATPGSPIALEEGAYRDCILIVDGIAPSANVSSYRRIFQTVIINSSSPKTYIRRGYCTSSANNTWVWDDWHETSFIDNGGYVNLTTDQIIAGYKTFSAASIRCANNSASKGTNPSSTLYWTLGFFDKNGASDANKLGQFRTTVTTSNNISTVSTYITAVKNVANSTDGVSIGVKYDSNGTSGYTFAPTPATSDNSTKIATTAFVKAQGYLTAHENLSVTTSGDGNAVTGVSVSGHSITVLKSLDFATAGHTHNYLPLTGGTLTGTMAISKSGNAMYYSRSTGNSTTANNWECMIGIGSSGRGGFYDNTRGFYFFERAPSTGIITIRAKKDDGSATGTYTFGTDGNLSATKFTGTLDGNATNVTGTVAIANGGTGATTRLNAIKALVNESVSTNATHFLGMKSDWSKVGYVSVADAKTVLGLGTAAYSSADTFAVSTHTHDYLPLSGGNLTGNIKLNSTSTVGVYKGNATSLAEFSGGSALNKGARLALYGESHASNAGRFDLIAGNASTSKSLIGKPDGTLTWGGQAVSTSSDERIKTKLQNVPEDILNAWEDIQWGEFKFLEAVADKGESARLHTGLVAQSVDRIFKEKNLDVCKYGILCHEEREATENEVAVDMWTVRYTEALAMEAAYQRHKNKILEKRISDLEEQLSSVLEILKDLKGA